MRDRQLTGPWAGFAFKGDRLVTPEGRELEPQDLTWLSLTAAQAQEWRRMMGMLSSAAPARRSEKPCGSRSAEVIDMATLMVQRQERSTGAMAGPNAEPPMAADTRTGPKPRARV